MDQVFQETLKMLQSQFPGKTMLTIPETADAYGLKPQSIYNSLRKNAVTPFPVKPRKRCGKWFFNIADVARDQAGVK
jgi:hypothetical protein